MVGMAIWWKVCNEVIERMENGEWVGKALILCSSAGPAHTKATVRGGDSGGDSIEMHPW